MGAFHTHNLGYLRQTTKNTNQRRTRGTRFSQSAVAEIESNVVGQKRRQHQTKNENNLLTMVLL